MRAIGLFLIVKSLTLSAGAAEPKVLLQILESLQSARKVLFGAYQLWNVTSIEDLAKHIQNGSVSRTDSVLTRHLQTDTGKEEQRREITIFINENQSELDQILDLAHELVHATRGPSWDPYDPRLTLDGYIYASLELPGGEIDAVREECRVAHEIFLKDGRNTSRCSRYWVGASGFEINQKKLLQDFYRVGEWNEKVRLWLGDHADRFPHLSAKDPALYSSTGNTPYPVALYYEYLALNKKACSNMVQRLAQIPTDSPQFEKTALFLKSRCLANLN